MRREEHPLGGEGMVEHRPRVGGAGRDRLLAEHVQPMLERRMGDRRMVAGRGGDVDEVELAGLGGQQRLGVRVDAGMGENLTRPLPAGSAHIRHRGDVDVVGSGEIGRHVALLGDESEPDEGTLEWTGHASASAVK
jgi:hypothetical protein